MSEQPAPARQDGPTPFERMTALATTVLAVPKAEIDKIEAARRKLRGHPTGSKKRPARSGKL